MHAAINLRGSVVPVVDLAIKLGREPSPLSRRSCIVIVEIGKAAEQMVTGVVADAVNQVIEFAPGDIEPPPAFGTGVRLQYLDGIAKIGESFVLVLNMNNLLAESAQALAVTAQELSTEAPSPASA